MAVYISGTVSENGAPVQREVRLYDRDYGVLVAETVSAANGDYIFEGLIEGREYKVVALDDDGGEDFNALIYDRVLPIAEYATWNPADKTANLTLSNADRTGSANNSTHETARATKNDFNTNTGGKFYWRVKVDALAAALDGMAGVRRTSDVITTGVFFHDVANRYFYWRSDGSSYTIAGGPVPGLVSYAAGDELMFAWDIPSNKLFTGKNGTWDNGGDPVAGTGETFNNMTEAEDWAPSFTTFNQAGIVTMTLIADAASLAASCPSGYTPGLPL